MENDYTGIGEIYGQDIGGKTSLHRANLSTNLLSSLQSRSKNSGQWPFSLEGRFNSSDSSMFHFCFSWATFIDLYSQPVRNSLSHVGLALCLFSLTEISTSFWHLVYSYPLRDSCSIKPSGYFGQSQNLRPY